MKKFHWYDKDKDAGRCVRCHKKQPKDRVGMFLCIACTRMRSKQARQKGDKMMHCGVCHEKGHNARTCKRRKSA